MEVGGRVCAGVERKKWRGKRAERRYKISKRILIFVAVHAGRQRGDRD